MTNHPKRNLSPAQRAVLEHESATGVCIRYVWTWLQDGEPVTRQVKALLAKGYMNDMYFSGGNATASITDAGRAALGR